MPDKDGYVWDFGLHDCRQRAFKMIRETRPYTITGSPQCTPFSTMQDLNMRTPESKAKVEKAREEGTKHLEFMLRGVHKRPLTAASWATECMTNIRSRPAVYTAEAHM